MTKSTNAVRTKEKASQYPIMLLSNRSEKKNVLKGFYEPGAELRYTYRLVHTLQM